MAVGKGSARDRRIRVATYRYTKVPIEGTTMDELKPAPLAPIEQREIDFYDDRIVAVLLPVAGKSQPDIYVPVRPLCEYLGIAWSPQLRRIKRDPVLSEAIKGVTVTVTPGGQQEMMCLPVDLVPGWLFGITAERVKPELREKIIRYQRECFRVLWQAFQTETLASAPTSRSMTSIAEVREFGLALTRLAEEHIALDARVATAEDRLDQASHVVGGLLRDMTQTKKDVADLARRVAPGTPITEEQAGDLQQRVKALAMLLTEANPGKNHFQAIWGELNRRCGVSGYRNIPAAKYPEVAKLLEDWQTRASLAAPDRGTPGE